MEWFSKNRTWLAALGFFILSATLRFLSANQSQHPSGWDGYYYVMQVHSWITFGYMQSPDFSLIYPFLAAITLITGEPILAFKIGVALIAGLLTTSVFYCIIRQRASWLMAIVACSYISFSPLVTYFVLQFPKNALGLAFFLLFVGSLKDLRIKSISLPAILFIATVLTHRMTGAFALLAIGLYAFKYIPWKWIIVAAVAVMTLSLLPGVIHFSDLERLDGQVDAMPHWAPLAFTGIFPKSLDLAFKADLVLNSAMSIAALALIIVKRKEAALNTWLWFIVVVIALFPFFAFEPGGLGHRFFMIAPAAIVVLLAQPIVMNKRWQSIASGALAVLFIVFSVFSYRSYKPWAFDAPNNAYSTIVDRLEERYEPGDYPLVIAHKGLAEIIIFKTNFDALNWLPPEEIPPNHVLRLTYRVLDSDFKKYLANDDYLRIRTIARGYFVVPEDAWQKFLTEVKKDNNQEIMRRIIRGNNPMEHRPYFINKGRIR